MLEPMADAEPVDLLAEWLDGIDLGKYAKKIAGEGYTMEKLKAASHDDLTSMGEVIGMSAKHCTHLHRELHVASTDSLIEKDAKDGVDDGPVVAAPKKKRRYW